MQIWATWLFYAVLVDLGDAVADEMGVPFDSISLEMLYRGMYHFGVAYDKGNSDLAPFSINVVRKGLEDNFKAQIGNDVGRSSDLPE